MSVRRMDVVSATIRAVAVAAMATWPSLMSAQGNLSVQGLGYPPGQLSTPATTMGGATGEADPFSALNPAALGLLSSAIVFFQAEPEYRALTFGGRMLRSSVTRFPMFVGAMPLGEKWAVGISASTLLDRTWEITRRDTQFVGPDTLAGTIRDRSEGSISDLRLAVSYAPASWLRVGVGGHAYSGRDVLQTLRSFDDTAHFAGTTQASTLSFGGNAVSLGVQTVWPRLGGIGVSYRRGGSLSIYDGNRSIGTGSVPDHFGVSAAYLGLRGTTIAARVAKDGWSALKGLSTNDNIHEAWDVGVGADVTGPRFGSSPVGLRAGARWRTLPFSTGGTPVKEQTLSGGFGFPMAGGRVELHLGVLHAARTSGTLSEKAWTISTGFGIRP